jgi:aryl-alcohol dehydrogenase-like predicted oxidoreductase
VIAGATNVEQVVANSAATQWRLTGDDMAEINALLDG